MNELNLTIEPAEDMTAPGFWSGLAGIAVGFGLAALVAT